MSRCIKQPAGETLPKNQGRLPMTTRRNFLKGAAASGITFCSCGMVDAAHAQPKAPRLPVKINGKRVLTVDVHSHCYFREAINLMGDAADKVLPSVKGVPEHFIVIEQRLKEMDAMAIDMEVLSINPFWYGKDRDTAAAIVKVNNEKLAELCASRPERFSAFASLSLQFPDLAVQQLETAIKKQGLRGGGYLGSYAARGDHACFVSPQNCNPNITLKKKPSEYLNQLYFDAMVFTPEGLRHLVAQVGASQVVLGTDHPIPWEQHPVDHVFATTTLSDKQKAAILGGNAARLFGMKEA